VIQRSDGRWDVLRLDGTCIATFPTNGEAWRFLDNHDDDARRMIDTYNPRPPFMGLERLVAFDSASWVLFCRPGAVPVYPDQSGAPWSAPGAILVPLGRPPLGRAGLCTSHKPSKSRVIVRRRD
jgi:hypothetical protein